MSEYDLLLRGCTVVDRAAGLHGHPIINAQSNPNIFRLLELRLCRRRCAIV